MNRRLLVTSVIATLAPHAMPAEPPTSRLEVVQAGGRLTPQDEARHLTVKFWLQQLVLSGLYRDVVLEATSEDWVKARQAHPRVHGTYAADSHIGIPERQLLTFDEILLPVPERGYPDFVYLKSGSRYWRVAKYDPWVFQKLRMEAGITDEIDAAVPRTLF